VALPLATLPEGPGLLGVGRGLGTRTGAIFALTDGMVCAWLGVPVPPKDGVGTGCRVTTGLKPEKDGVETGRIVTTGDVPEKLGASTGWIMVTGLTPVKDGTTTGFTLMAGL